MTDELPNALDVVNEMLCIDGVVTHKGNEIKCWVHDGEGGRCKTYLTEDDCDTLASAFRTLASRLALLDKCEGSDG